MGRVAAWLATIKCQVNMFQGKNICDILAGAAALPESDHCKHAFADIQFD